MEYSKQQHFDSDYMEGAYPKILERLIETNMIKTPGYGGDDFCKSAKEKILAACECEELLYNHQAKWCTNGKGTFPWHSV